MSARHLLRRSIVVVLCGLLFVPAIISQSKSAPPTGLWDGTIQSRAGGVEFGIDLQRQSDGSLQATLVNATDRQPFSSADWHDGTLTLRMNYYDGVMILHAIGPGEYSRMTSKGMVHIIGPQGLEGEYSRLPSKRMVHIPVALTPHPESPAHLEVVPIEAWTGPTLAGDWVFTWPGETGAEKTTRASFQQERETDGFGRVRVTGTIEPVSGDTGLLHGFVFQGSPNAKVQFHLSRFDGIHVLAIDGMFLPDGGLKGQQGGIKGLDAFTAVRAKDAKTADPWMMWRPSR